jgi:heat shock protein HslJ
MNALQKLRLPSGRPYQWLAVLLILGLALAACQDQPEATSAPEAPAATEAPAEPAAEPAAEEPPAEPPAEEPPQPVQLPVGQLDDLVDELWVLVGFGDALNPAVVEAGTVITAVFTRDGAVSGSDGCNNYSAAYEADDNGNISIGPAATTRMACEPEVMEQEQAYLAALGGAQTYAINEQGRLEIFYDSGANFDEKLVYAPGETPLENTEWLLVEYGDPEEPTAVADGTVVTAVFVPESEGANSGIVGGVATCNNYSLPYTITEDGGLTTMPGPVTLMACPLAPEQETAYLGAMGLAQSYRILGARLEITYDGGVLVYTSLSLPLENTLWKVTLLNGAPLPEDVEMSALFFPGDEAGMGTVGGSAACNSYNGGYEVEGENLTIGGPIATTLAFCPDPINELEQAYLATLQTAETYQILGDQLQINSADGVIVYQADRAPLQGTLWELVSIGAPDNPQPPVEGSEFTAIFLRSPEAPSGVMIGTTGCNEYNATFAASLDEIKINLPSKTTNEDCPWGAGDFEVEQQYFLGLNSAHSYTILGNELFITDGSQLFVYRATELPVEEGVDLTALDGTFWYLVSLDAQALIPGTEITAGFSANEGGQTGEIFGSAGCNNYNAAIGENFSIGPAATTRKACQFPPGVMEQEQAYLAFLQEATSYSIAGEQLLINTASGVLTYSANQPEPSLDQTAELQGRTWYLVSYGNLAPVQFAEPTAIFDTSGTVSGVTGCNDYNGPYTTEPGNVLSVGSLATTRSACTTDALAQQEQTYTAMLQSAVNYLIVEGQLNIITADESVMNFTTTPPAGATGPTAVINAPSSAGVGEVVVFDGSSSQAGSAAIVSYEWNLGDGTDASGPVVQYAYSGPGSFNVSLTVVDGLGQSNTATSQIAISAVADQPPTAAIQGPATADIGQQVTYSAAASTAGSAPITRYIWNFGDGNTDATSEPPATTLYSQAGVYQVTVTVQDANGLSDSASTQTSVNATMLGTEWLLNGTIQGTSINLVFGNGTLSGFGGCNSYNAAYTADTTASSGSISIGTVNSTGALCSEEISGQEQAYFADLGTAASFSISGNSLTLTTAGGGLVYRGVPVATILPVVN